MEWKVFTYDKDKSPEVTYPEWIERLLNSVKAENIYVVSENVLAVYYPSNRDGEVDEYGNII